MTKSTGDTKGHWHQNAGPGVGQLVPYWAGLNFFFDLLTKDILNGQKVANVMCGGVSIAFT